MKFRKKPVVIEAIQWTGKNQSAIHQHVSSSWDAVAGMRIHTLEGDLSASVGDWIIRGVKGEGYPCKPDIFEETYTVEGVTAAPVDYRTLYVNVYRGGWLGAHWTRDFADSAALSIGVPREACVETSFVDGQGLATEPVQADPAVLATDVAETPAEGPVASPEGVWRQGRYVQQSIYLDDEPVCMVASGELAARMVAALNAGDVPCWQSQEAALEALSVVLEDHAKEVEELRTRIVEMEGQERNADRRRFNADVLNRGLVNRISALEEELSGATNSTKALAARIVELEKGLRPFAEGRLYDGEYGDDKMVCVYVPLGAKRHAAALLSASDRPVVSPEAPQHGNGDDWGWPAGGVGTDETRKRVLASIAQFRALSPEQQEAELRAQQESWVRGEMGMREADGRRTGRPANNDHEDDCA